MRSMDIAPPAHSTLHGSWHHEQLFNDNDNYFDALFASIDEARHSIILATYIFELDSLGRKMIRHLSQAKARGVDVRVLYDGVGSWVAADRIARKLERADIPVRIYHPLPWQMANNRRAVRRRSWLSSLVLSLLKINQRHHSKVCIVDHSILWCGSQNITADHLSTGRGGGGWHDYGAQVTGRDVKTVVDTFEHIWSFRRAPLAKRLFRHHWHNLTDRSRQHKNRLIAAHIASARHKVWIINPYFSPTRAIIQALLQAAAKGADVRLIVPAKSDLGFFPLLTSTYYAELIRNEVRIFEYLPTILHAKILIADEFCLIGSTNLNHRSLLHDVEFDIVLDSPHSVRISEQFFKHDQSQSREVMTKHVRLLGRRRWLGWIPWLMRYWL